MLCWGTKLLLLYGIANLISSILKVLKVSEHLSLSDNLASEATVLDGLGSVMKGDFVLKNGFPQGAIDSPSHPPLGLKGQTPLYNSSEQAQAYITGNRLLNHIQITLLSHCSNTYPSVTITQTITESFLRIRLFD